MSAATTATARPVSMQVARAALQAWPVGAQADIARALGVSRQRVGQLQRMPGFPQPVQKVNGTDVWIVADAVAWHRERFPNRKERTT